MKIKIAQFGLGPIGIESLRLAATKPWADIVGGVDIDPAKAGQPLSKITGLPLPDSVRVHASFAELIAAQARPDLVIHTSVSRFPDAMTQMKPIVEAGCSIVSSCEELLFPHLKYPDLAAEFHALCQTHGAKVLGTGVNPGFVMDALAVCLTWVCRRVESIEIERVVDASKRRLPLQKKIGSGLQPEEFRRLFQEGKMGHVGLVESLALIAHAMNWQIGRIAETCEPILAHQDIQTEFLNVESGQTRGIHHCAQASTHEGRRVSLDLKMYLHAENPRDVIRIDGDPSVNAILQDGIHGDRATVAALVNAVPRVMSAAPGLLLMTDIPLPRMA